MAAPTMKTLTSLSLSCLLLLASGCAASTSDPPNDESAETQDQDLSAAVAAFDALDDEAKLNALYEDYTEEAWGLEVKDGFKQAPITIARLPRSVAAAGEAAFDEERAGARDNGGDARLYVVKKARSTFAYVVEASGRSYGNWAATTVYDRKFARVGAFSAAD
jgi:hypothetical protein